MHKLIVSIFPTYACNCNCNFCYLNKLHSNKVLDLDILRKRLQEITKYFEIEKFNTYGGEITLLDTEYLVEFNSILNQYKATNYITSNLYDITKLKLFTNCYIGTSLNEEREDYKYIKKQLKQNIGIVKDIGVLSMITPSIINKSAFEVLSSYNNLNLDRVSFIKYYPNVDTGDVFKITQAEYEKCLIDLVDTYLKNKNCFDFELSTIPGLIDCIKRTYPIATNDQIIRINPDGKYCSVFYTEDNLEYFKEYNTIEEYIIDAKEEAKRYRKKCGFCKYYGTCWTEHVTNLKCDGCKDLLLYAEKNLV